MGSWQISLSIFWGASSKYPGIDDIIISTSGLSNRRLLPTPPTPNTSRIVKTSHLYVFVKKKKIPSKILHKFTYNTQHSKLTYSHTRHTLAQTVDYCPNSMGIQPQLLSYHYMSFDLCDNKIIDCLLPPLAQFVADIIRHSFPLK